MPIITKRAAETGSRKQLRVALAKLAARVGDSTAVRIRPLSMTRHAEGDLDGLLSLKASRLQPRLTTALSR